MLTKSFWPLMSQITNQTKISSTTWLWFSMKCCSPQYFETACMKYEIGVNNYTLTLQARLDTVTRTPSSTESFLGSCCREATSRRETELVDTQSTEGHSLMRPSRFLMIPQVQNRFFSTVDSSTPIGVLLDLTLN